VTSPGTIRPGADNEGAGGALTIAPEPFESPDAQSLVAELAIDLDERYAADGLAEGDSPDAMAEHAVRADQVTPPRGVLLVARVDGRAVGCAAVRPLRGGPPGVAEIKRMYTVPAARRRGVSRALPAGIEAEARALGYQRLQLVTGLRQPEAIALYGSAGYFRIASYGQFEDDDLLVCFAKDLTSG
jgi:GNAT superfamily N-acetyltransferase